MYLRNMYLSISDVSESIHLNKSEAVLNVLCLEIQKTNHQLTYIIHGNLGPMSQQIYHSTRLYCLRGVYNSRYTFQSVVP